MAKLPSVENMPMQAPRPASSVATYPRQFGGPGRIGEEIAGAGQVVQQGQNEADAFNYATAKSAYLVRSAQLESQIQQDPNWQTADQTYRQGMTDAQQEAAKLISNPVYQKRFQVEAAVAASDGETRVKSFMQKRRVDQGRADLDSLIQNNVQTALSAPDQAPGLISAMNDAISGAAAKGFISQVEAVNARQKAAETYGRGWLALQPPDQALHVLTGGQSGLPSLGQPEKPEGPSVPANMGNVKAKDGTFAMPATPTDGVVLAANNLRSGYRGLTIPQIAQKWVGTDQPPDQITAWAQNVARASGLPLDKKPNLDDPATLKALMRGISVAEKAPQDQALFTPAVIEDGVTAALGGQKANLGTSVANRNVPIESQALQVVAKTGTPADFIPIQDRAVIARQAQNQAKSALDVPIASRAIQDTLQEVVPGLTGPVQPRTLAQFYGQNYEKVLDRARALAAPYGDPALTDRAVASAQQQMDKAIHAQQVQDKANRQIVDGALDGRYSQGAMPLSENDLLSINPQVAQAWTAYKESDPEGAQQVVTKLMTANAQGHAQGLGSNFYPKLLSSLALGNDPNAVLYAPKFLPYVGAGPGAELTNTGYGALRDILAVRATPDGPAFRTQMLKLVQQAHSQLTASDPRTGVADAEGDKRFDAAMGQVFANIRTEMQAKTPISQMFDPKSDHYVGRPIALAAPEPGHMFAEKFASGNVFGPQRLPPQRQALIAAAIKGKEITEDQGQKLIGIATALANNQITRQRYYQLYAQIVPPGTAKPAQPAQPAQGGQFTLPGFE